MHLVNQFTAPWEALRNNLIAEFASAGIIIQMGDFLLMEMAIITATTNIITIGLLRKLPTISLLGMRAWNIIIISTFSVILLHKLHGIGMEPGVGILHYNPLHNFSHLGHASEANARSERNNWKFKYLWRFMIVFGIEKFGDAKRRESAAAIHLAG